MIDTQDIYTCLLIKLLCVAARGMYKVSIFFLKSVAGSSF